MKKASLLLIGLLLAAGMAKGQNVSMEFIPFHYPGYDIFQFDNKIMQQRNGDLVANVLVAIPSGDNLVPPTIVGNKFYKVSPSSLQFVDSLFVADSTPAWYLFAQHPRCEGNLRVNTEADGNGGTALRISHFPDDNLAIDHDEDVVVPLLDTIAFDYPDSYMIDSQDDLLVKYYTEGPNWTYVCHVARYGLDGTLKYATELPENQNFMITMDEFESTPKQYYQWKRSGENQDLFIYVLDSLFHVKNYHVVNKVLYSHFYVEDSIYVMERFQFGSGNDNSTFVVPDEGDVLVAAPYQRDSGFVQEFHEEGAAVARYELRSMQRKALAYFNDWHGAVNDVRVMAFHKTCDGDYYLVYRELTPQYDQAMTAVKLDRDLNVIWKRYCYEPGALKVEPNMSCYSGMFKDENGNELGLYIAGYSYRTDFQDSGLFFFFITEEGLSVGENVVEVRPYAFYPNPTQTELYLQYSPDVTPKQIELYDLQGRLVQTQSKNLESLNMAGLPAGTYMMRVMLEDGKVFSDKVVKE